MFLQLGKWMKEKAGFSTNPTGKSAAPSAPRAAASLYQTKTLYPKAYELDILTLALQELLHEDNKENLNTAPITLIVNTLETILMLCEASPMHAEGFLAKTVHAAIDRDTYILGFIRPMEMVIKRKFDRDQAEAARGALLIVSLDKLNRLFHANHTILVKECGVSDHQLLPYSKAVSSLVSQHVADVAQRLSAFASPDALAAFTEGGTML
jgi:hypothetical protein